ncbi:MAG: tetratricopeptide repeat protein, partial [Acidiferrobacterales bacterium]
LPKRWGVSTKQASEANYGRRITASWLRSLRVICCSALLLALDSAQASDDLRGAIQLFTSQHYQEARAALELILVRDKDDAEVRYYLGRTYLALCDYDNAARHCKRAAELDPDNAGYHFWLGRTYGVQARHSGWLKQAGLAPKIKLAFEQSVALDPKYIPARYGLGNFYLQAPGLMGGDIEKASAQARALLDLGAPQGKLLLALILEKQGKADRAEAEYRELERQSRSQPLSRALYKDYGRFLLRQKRYDEAVAKLKQAVALAPEDFRVRQSLGDAYEGAGRQRDAAAAHRRARALKKQCVSPAS